jgi:hypothetical protein
MIKDEKIIKIITIIENHHKHIVKHHIYGKNYKLQAWSTSHRNRGKHHQQHIEFVAITLYLCRER